MATTSRDAKLVLSVESLGQENITKLEKSLRDLAATGDASAAEFGALADQINRLGAQNDALQAVKTLSADTQGLVDAQEKAAASATTLAANLDVLKAATTQAKVEQDTARAALVAGETAYTKAGNALRELKAEYDAAGKNSTDYRTKLQGLTAEQSRANLALVELRENNRQATAAVREANTEQNKAEGAYKRAATQMRVATAAADEHSKALDIAGNAAEKLGVDIANLADAETKLVATFSQAAAAAVSRKQALQEMAEADRLAAREADTLAAMLKRGEAALWAEEAALREAARGAQEYAAAKAKAAADGANWQKEADEIVSLSLAQRAATRSTQDMVEKLRELAANNAFAKQAEEARKMVQSAEYARFWADALDEADRKQQDLAANTKKVNDALAQINVRPIEAIQREIDETNAAMQTLAASGKLTGGALAVAMSSAESKVNSLQREMRELTGTMTTADRAADLLKNSMGQIAAGNLIADGLGALINKVKDMGREFFQANLDIERLNRTMLQITGSTETAAAKIEFLKGVANDAGVSVTGVTDAFIRFQAAASASGMAGEEVDAMFRAVTVNGSKMGMSTDRVSLALEALSQIASKGTVSMEELRQQLGDSLPGAMQIAAKGLGLTTGELTKLVETGQLSAAEFFPAFRQGMAETFGSADEEVKGFMQGLQRLRNVLVEFYQRANDTGVFRAIGTAADAVAKNFDTLVSAVTGLGSALLALKLVEYVRNLGAVSTATKVATTETIAHTAATTASTTAIAANAAATRGQAAAQAASAAAATAAIGVFAGVAKAVGALGGAVKGLFALMGGLPGLLVAVALNAKELGTWIGETAAKFTGAGAAMRKYEAELAALAAKEKQAAAEREAATAKALEGARKQVVAQAKTTKALGDEYAATKKATEAQREQGGVLERLAALSGDVRRIKADGVVVAERNAAAAERESQKLNEFVAALEAEVAARQQAIAASKVTNVTAQEELEKRQALLAKTKEEAAALAANARGMEIEAAERRISVALLQDNSSKVAEYTQRVKDSEAALQSLKTMEAQGLDVKPAIAKAEIAIAENTRLRTDATADLAEKTTAQNTLDLANNAALQAGLSVRQQAYEQLAEAARASGDLATATYYEVEAKRVQIQITKAVAEAKLLEVKAARAAIEAEREQLLSNGKLTEAKKLELDARLANLKAKEIEAGASATVIKALEAEIDAIQRGINTRNGATGSINNETNAISANISERERSIATREKEIELQEREQQLRDKAREGSATMANDLGSRTGIVNFLKQAGVTDEAAAKRIANEFADSKGDIVYSNNPGQLKYGGAFSTISQALLKAAEQFTFSEAGMKVSGKASSTSTPDTTGATTSGSGTQSSAPGKTVNVNIGGRTTRVNVASDSDASALVGLLRQLENDGSTAA